MLDGKVAAVTNAGRGMGRAIALLMVDEGARVVVHDSDGFERDGGVDPSLLDGVVQEINDSGGEAVANGESVASWEGGHSLIQSALEHFGRLDILVNSVNTDAGLQGSMISEIGKEEWELVQRAYLKATFCCVRAALPHMRKQRHGRLIQFVFSEAVSGRLGHTHHGAVQMAVAGLSRNAAIEMERYHVTSNCIVPCSGPDSPCDPADVAPLVVFLASDAAQNLTGQIFGVRDKEILLFSQPRIQRSIHNSEGWTVERLSEMFESTMQPHFTASESWDSKV